MKLARVDTDETPSELRGIVVAVVLGVALGALVLLIATRFGSALGG